MTDENKQDGQDEKQDEQKVDNAQQDEPGKKSDSGKVFTQAELNDIIQGRLSKQEKSIADKLGMTPEEAAKQLKAIADKEEAEKSAIDKLQEELQEFKKQAETERQKAARIKRESQIKDAAVNLNFQDPADAITFLDVDAITYDDDGNVANAEELLNELAEKKDYLIKKTSSFQNPANPGGGKKPQSEAERLEKYGYSIPKR
jgi:hypothetical protein